jgi:hypothetical protein
MSEGDYEYELMRSELLGLPPPEKKPLPPVNEDKHSSDVEDHGVEGNEVCAYKMKKVTLTDLLLLVSIYRVLDHRSCEGSLTIYFKISIRLFIVYCV